MPGILVAMKKSETLFKAIEGGDVTGVRTILDHSPELLEAFGEHNRSCRDKTPLMYALQCGHLRLAGELLDRGANPRACMAGGPGSSVIGLAVRFMIGGRDNSALVAFVDRLIGAGADPDDALLPACLTYNKAFDQPQLIELLLRRGANADNAAGNSGDTVRQIVKVNARLYSDHVLELFGLSKPT